MSSSDDPGASAAAVPPTIETTTTSPDGSVVRNSECNRPDGSKSVVVGTFPSGNRRSAETTKEHPSAYSPPPPPVAPAPEVRTAKQLDGSSTSRTVMQYPDGTGVEIEEEARPEFTDEAPSAFRPSDGPGPSECPQDVDPEAKPSFWSRRRSQITVVVLALLVVICAVLGELFGTGTISTAAQNEGLVLHPDEEESSPPTPPPVAPPTPLPETPSSPTPLPVPPSPPTRPPKENSSALMAMAASSFVVLWGGRVDEGWGCNRPTPGLRISCGPGGFARLLAEANDTEGACRELPPPAAGTIECGHGAGVNSTAGYACVGSVRSALSTSVEIVPDPSVSCEMGGRAADFLYLAVNCSEDASLDYNSVACGPSDAARENEEGDTFCAVIGHCWGGDGCNFRTGNLTASVAESDIADDCLLDVTEEEEEDGDAPMALPTLRPTTRPAAMPTRAPTIQPSAEPTPEPGPPSPGPVPTAAPSSTHSEMLAAVYIVEWYGGNDGNCAVPSSSVSVTCGASGTPVLLEDSGTGRCITLPDVILCSAFDSDTSVSLSYMCLGRNPSAWTTWAEVLTDGSVSCASDGAAEDFVYLARDCPDAEVYDYNSMVCDPPEAASQDTVGNDYCFAVDSCLVESGCASLSIPPVSSYIPENAIETACLYELLDGDDDGNATAAATPSPAPSPPTPGPT